MMPPGLATAMTAAQSYLPQNLPVIVADDDPMSRRLLQLHLRRWGVNCDLVPDGGALLDALRKGAYGAAIVDGAMPILGGVDAVLAIRSGETGAHHRDMLIVAHSGQGELRRPFRSAGADWFIEKPLHAETLRQALQLARLVPPALGQTPVPFLRPHALSLRSVASFA